MTLFTCVFSCSLWSVEKCILQCSGTSIRSTISLIRPRKASHSSGDRSPSSTRQPSSWYYRVKTVQKHIQSTYANCIYTIRTKTTFALPDITKKKVAKSSFLYMQLTMVMYGILQYHVNTMEYQYIHYYISKYNGITILVLANNNSKWKYS